MIKWTCTTGLCTAVKPRLKHRRPSPKQLVSMRCPAPWSPRRLERDRLCHCCHQFHHVERLRETGDLAGGFATRLGPSWRSWASSMNAGVEVVTVITASRRSRTAQARCTVASTWSPWAPVADEGPPRPSEPCSRGTRRCGHRSIDLPKLILGVKFTDGIEAVRS
jgi:hypothetical protein